MTAEEYMEQFGDKIELNYKTYEPKKEILEELTQILTSKNESLKILVLGADWCPDCNKNVPRMIKIIRNIKNVKIEFKILYGIMKNALHKKHESLWHKTRSPPEAVDPKFDLRAIPTFYLFDSSGNLLDAIIENPKNNSTLEEEMLSIIKSS
jgi:thioredoxin-related protein